MSFNDIRSINPVTLASFSQKSIEYKKNLKEIVYHYCDLETFYKIINNETIRLSNIKKSNDLFETKFIINYLLKELEQFINKINEIISDENYKLSDSVASNLIDKYFNNNIAKMYFVLSFSEEKNMLNQWRNYGDEARGIAIGFNAAQLNSLQTLESGFIFGKVIYDIKQVKESIENEFKIFFERCYNLSDKDKYANFINFCYKLVNVFVYYAPMYKSPDFKDEQEWRLIYIPQKYTRNIDDKNFYEWHIGFEETTPENLNGFERLATGYICTNGGLRAYIDLKFSKIKQSLIKEIAIGSNCPLDANDADLHWFLSGKGYTRKGDGKFEALNITKTSNQYISKK